MFWVEQFVIMSVHVHLIQNKTLKKIKLYLWILFKLSYIYIISDQSQAVVFIDVVDNISPGIYRDLVLFHPKKKLNWFVRLNIWFSLFSLSTHYFDCCFYIFFFLHFILKTFSFWPESLTLSNSANVNFSKSPFQLWRFDRLPASQSFKFLESCLLN